MSLALARVYLESTAHEDAEPWPPPMDGDVQLDESFDADDPPAPPVHTAAAPAGTQRAAVIAQLRAHINSVAPARDLRSTTDRLPSGLDALDAQTRGWPRPGVAEIAGHPGTGRLRLVAPAIQALTRRQRVVAVVDPLGWLNPPGLPDADWSKLLLVRPGATRVGWAAEQLARCGALELVVVLDPPPLRRGGRRLRRAAEDGNCAVIVISQQPDTDLPCQVRLRLDGRSGARITRGGRGGHGVVSLPPV